PAGARRLRAPNTRTRLTQLAAEAALSDLPHIRANVVRIRTTRARLTTALEQLGYQVPPSSANFVLARRPGIDQAPIAAALAERDVLVRHFPTKRLHDALRITVGTDEEIDALLAHLRDLAKS